MWLSFYYRCVSLASKIQSQIDSLRNRVKAQITLSKMAFALHRLDNNPITKDVYELRLFAIMRNEALRLPYFIEYYKRLGVDRFFIIDNNSSDLSRDIALQHSEIHVFSTDEPYQEHWRWMTYMLDRYGLNHWCLVVDIDELFSFPFIEKIRLKHLCRYLEESNNTALKCFLLDMYSDSTISETICASGQNPLSVLRFFDASFRKISVSFKDWKRNTNFTSVVLTGGMRDRVFGYSPVPHFLSKVPLFKYLPNTYLAQGMHAINGAKFSSDVGVVFHTKFLNDFENRVYEECQREQHFDNAQYYKMYRKKFELDPSLNLFDINSVKFEDLAQLRDLDLIHISTDFERYVDTRDMTRSEA